jgi:biotin transport system substrate-specific component
MRAGRLFAGAIAPIGPRGKQPAVEEQPMQPNPTSPALAVAVWPAGANRLVRAIALVLAGTVVLAVSAKISVPFYPVPMTLQTFAIMALAAAYGSRLAVATVIAYLAEGLAGIPVFAGAGAGPAYVLGPTGGFLAGFIALAFIVGIAADRGWDRSIPKLFAAMIVADVVVFVLGVAWLAWFAQLSSGATGIGAASAFTNGVAPFVLADLLKIALAALAVPAAWRLVEGRAA